MKIRKRKDNYRRVYRQPGTRIKLIIHYNRNNPHWEKFMEIQK